MVRKGTKERTNKLQRKLYYYHFVSVEYRVRIMRSTHPYCCIRSRSSIVICRIFGNDVTTARPEHTFARESSKQNASAPIKNEVH